MMMTRLRSAPGLALACSPDSGKHLQDWLPEHRIHCPFCGEAISIVVDLSAGSQAYIEDCQVCCQPMQITIDVDDSDLLSVRAEA